MKNKIKSYIILKICKFGLWFLSVGPEDDETKHYERRFRELMKRHK